MAETNETYLDLDTFRTGNAQKTVRVNNKDHVVKDTGTMTLGDWLDLGLIDKRMADVWTSKNPEEAITAGLSKVRLLIPTLSEEELRGLEAAKFLELLNFVSKQAAKAIEGNRAVGAEGKAKRHRAKSASRRR